MKLYEYAAKEVFSKYDIPVPEGALATSPDEAVMIVERLGTAVIKAQVLAGGRGKAGGISIVSSGEESRREAQRILDLKIKGFPVKKLMVEKYKKPKEELYLGITIDRKARCPVIMASTAGGINIEEIAKDTPEKILRVHINPLTGIHDYQSRRIASYLGSTQLDDIIRKLYCIFSDNDCVLSEINPLALTDDGIFALDAKLLVDDNALYRQDFEEEKTGSLEEVAKMYGMSYVDLEGDIGCIVNGAGLAMATLDMIKKFGGEPANFMDVRAGANAEQVKIALELISSRKKLRSIIINIFGGITKCDEVARGIIEVLPSINMPLVIRLTGTNEEAGREMLGESGITTASSTEEAAAMVVGLEHSGK